MLRRSLIALLGFSVLATTGCPTKLDRTPEILLFTASPTELDGGGPVTLEWITRNVTSLDLQGAGGEAIDTGSAMPGQGQIRIDVTRAGFFSFVLVGIGDDDVRTEPWVVSISVTNIPDPEVLQFSVDRSEFAAGETVNLSYRVRYAAEVSISDSGGNRVLSGATDQEGTVGVSPTVDETYTLVATGRGGQTDTATLSVIVHPAPAIVTFATDPSPAALAGTDVILSWETTDTEQIRLRDSSGVVLLDSTTEVNGTFTVTPNQNSSWELEAINAWASVRSSVQIETFGPPIIESFTANPDIPVAPGGDVTLSWSTTEIDTVRLLDDGGNELLPSTPSTTMSHAIQPLATTVYTLEGTGPGGTISQNLTVVVDPLPVIDSFTFGPASPIDPGSDLILSWETTDTTRVRLFDAQGVVLADTIVDLDGSRTLPVPHDTSFSLEATNNVGLDTASVAVETLVVIDRFEGVPSTIQPGGVAAMQWDARGGESYSLTTGASTVCAGTHFGRATSNSCNYGATPTTLGIQTFNLVITSPAGQVASAQTTVLVSDGPSITTFDASVAAITVGDPLTLSWTTLDDPSGTTPTLSLTDDQGGAHDVSALNANADSFIFTPTVPGTYVFTLVASTSGSTPATSTVSVLIAPVPLISSLQASPELLDTVLGIDRSDLGWTTTGGASAWLWELDAGGAPISPAVWQSVVPAEIDAFALTVIPTVTTTYRLEVWNAASATTTAEVTVRVDELGFIALDLSPTQIVAGESATLSWTASSLATSVSISPGLPMNLEAPTGTFQDISVTGAEVTNLTTSDFTGDIWDEGVALTTLPFSFPLFGVPQTEVVITTNGYLSFDTSLSDPAAGHPSTMPSTGNPNGGLISPFWDDLDGVSAAGTLYTESGSDAGGNYFIIQWSNYQFWSFSPHGDLNFQVWLWEDGSIETRYGSMSSASDQAMADGSGVLQGVESVDGSSGTLIAIDTAASGGLSNTGWRLTPVGGLSSSATLSPTTSTDYTVCANDAATSVCETLRLVVVQPGDLMLSELMLAPAAATAPDAIWVELLNTSAETLDLSGWILTDGVGNFAISPGAPLFVGPGGYLVLAGSADPALNGGITGAEAFGTSLTLVPAAGTLTLSTSTLTVDTVTWDGAWTLPSGASLQTTTLTPGDETANDPFSAWCDADTPYGDGDLGTPGTANTTCP